MFRQRLVTRSDSGQTVYLVLLIIAALALLGAVPAAKIQSMIAKPTVLCGRFDQTKQLVGLKKPVKSRGRFCVLAEKGVLWRSEWPFANTIKLTRDEIVQLQGERVAMRLEAKKEPTVRMINSVLFALLAGDLDQLEKLFEIDGDVNHQSWHVTLKPRTAALARAIGAITLDGAEYVGTKPHRRRSAQPWTLELIDARGRLNRKLDEHGIAEDLETGPVETLSDTFAHEVESAQAPLDHGRQRTHPTQPPEGVGALVREDHHADVGVVARVGEGRLQLLDGLGPEGVAHLGPVDRDLRDPFLGLRIEDVGVARNESPGGDRRQRRCLHSVFKDGSNGDGSGTWPRRIEGAATSVSRSWLRTPSPPLPTSSCWRRCDARIPRACSARLARRGCVVPRFPLEFLEFV